MSLSIGMEAPTEATRLSSRRLRQAMPDLTRLKPLMILVPKNAWQLSPSRVKILPQKRNLKIIFIYDRCQGCVCFAQRS